MKVQKKIEQNFTTVHNEFLKDTSIGIAEKGLLLYMLSLPDWWNFSIAGLAEILKEGKYKVGSALKRLERAGYLRRIRETDERGRVIDWVYEFSDEKQLDWINNSFDVDDNIDRDNQNEHSENNDDICVCPDPNFPVVGNCTQSNTIQTNTISDYSDQESIAKTIDSDDEYKNEFDYIADEIGRNILIGELGYAEKEIDDVISIITDAVTSEKKYQRIGKNIISTDKIKNKLAKISYEHIDYVLYAVHKQQNVKNIKSYLLTSLYNSIDGFNNYINRQYNKFCKNSKPIKSDLFDKFALI